MSDRLLLMAEIVGVHGVKGEIKLKLFGEDARLLVKTPVYDAKGAALCTLTRAKGDSDYCIAAIEGVEDRSAAEKWRGKKLYLPRAALPKIKKKNTFYHVDLMGLEARHVDGHVLGKVIGVANYGAGDLLDIQPPKGNSFFVPFKDEFVPDVDVDGGFVTIDPPQEMAD